MVISNSLIEGNWATNANVGTGRGGGIFNLGTLQISDSTVSNNFALLRGGGLFNGLGATATLTSVTVRDNSAVNAMSGRGRQGRRIL